MNGRRFKWCCFGLEGLNAYATSFYFYYLFVFMAREFGFGNKHNLLLSAFYGLLYTFSAWYGGRIGQRFGYLPALGIGIAVMGLALVGGAFVSTAIGQVMVLVIWTFGICLTWPNLEAVISEGESPLTLPWMLGIYNVVWAGMGAVAFFTGGVLLELFGMRSLFWVPVIIHVAQLAFMLWMRTSGAKLEQTQVHWIPEAAPPPALNPRPIARARTFLKLGWVANPFAYVAINTVVAVIPGIARELKLTPAYIGYFCSIWFFSRLAAFVVLWLWSGWHYRFRWFIAAYVVLIAGFVLILIVPELWVITLAQVGFGAALGLIYYSSLFYSMDAGEAKAEHGGVHEAAIGSGIFVGPAVGAGALYLFPEQANSGTVAVSVLLLIGLALVLWIYLRARPAFEPRRSRQNGN